MVATKPFVRASKFGLSVVALLLLSTTCAFARHKHNAPQVQVPVLVANSDFEESVTFPANQSWTNNDIPGWNVLPGSVAGVWRAWSNVFQPSVLDGENLLYINAGGIWQTLPVNLQPNTDYTVSTEWLNRMDIGAASFQLKLKAGGQLLATCSPQAVPPRGYSATVTLVYHSGRVPEASGQPISIEIDYYSGRTPYSMCSLTGAQVDLDDVEVTSAPSDTNGSGRTSVQCQQTSSW